jgi:uncharacterized membrane protein YhaH (DUF805 family)
MNYYTDVLKKYAVFSGRARRKEYWMFALWNLIVIIVLSIVFTSMGVAIKNSLLTIVVDLYALAVFLPSLGVFVRRLHDTGRTGWWFFIGFIPLVGAIILLVFTVQDSKPGDNKYGPNPKGITGPQAAPQAAAGAN